jgi:hypothetical protein
MKLPPNVVVVDKVGARGQAISQWDKDGDVLSKEVTVPKSGWYRVRLRYCSASIPERSLLINGQVPFAGVADFQADATIGDPPSTGWSTTTSDWREIILGPTTVTTAVPSTTAAPDGWKIFLPKGPAQIGLRNDGGGGMNLDWIELEPAKN